MNDEIKDELECLISEVRAENKEIQSMDAFNKDFKKGYESAINDLQLMINNRIKSLT